MPMERAGVFILPGFPILHRIAASSLRAIYYAAHQEEEMFRFYVTNMDTELAVFEKTGKIAVINNSKEPRQTDLYVHGKVLEQLDLAPMEMRWVDFKENL